MDKLMELVFLDQKGWEDAIQRAVDKDICIKDLQEMCSVQWRQQIYKMVRDHQYKVFPPHAVDIPKNELDENGKMKYRTVYVNEPKDRVLFIRIYHVLADNTKEMVHPVCRSYQKGISCGDTVRDLSRRICAGGDGIVGWKTDFSKYFDNVPINLIDDAFDQLERKFGKSSIIDLLRDYYHTDLYFDTHNQLCSEYKSLKQGCAVAAWLANVILYDVDDAMSKRNDAFRRYCDDSMYIAPDWKEAFEFFKHLLEDKGIMLNAKKTEYIDSKHWVKFLGYSIKGKDISFSRECIKKLQKEIDDACLKGHKSPKTGKWNYPTYDIALKRVMRILYNPGGKFAWATRLLRYVNVTEDIRTIDEYVKDALRATQTGHRKIGGLGWQKGQRVGCVQRGRGQNVRANRQRTEPILKGYHGLIEMRNALWASRYVYDALLR